MEGKAGEGGFGHGRAEINGKQVVGQAGRRGIVKVFREVDAERVSQAVGVIVGCGERICWGKKGGGRVCW